MCEICGLNVDEEVKQWKRQWHDGTIDVVQACTTCAVDDPDGAWAYFAEKGEI